MHWFEHLTVTAEHRGLELDEFLCLFYPELSKGFLRAMIRDARVRVDGAEAQPGKRLHESQVVSLGFDPDEAPLREVSDDSTEVPVLYEDDDLLVVDKPAGVAVEPERWARSQPSLTDLLVRAVRNAKPAGDDPNEGAGLEGEGSLTYRPRLAHRLDKDTSGVLVVAKHLESERALRIAFEERRIQKVYFALVDGEYPLEDGEVEEHDAPILAARHGKRVRLDPAGKPACTRVSIEQRFRGFTLMRCEPVTGRTHQIRIHLSARGFPLSVDPLYGSPLPLLLSAIKPGYRRKPGRVEKPLLARLALHAREIEFPHPGRQGAPLRVSAPIPEDLALTLKQLAKVRPYGSRP